jgi:YVTN family beta-propeller protein
MPQKQGRLRTEEMTKMTNKQLFHGGLTTLAGLALCTVFIFPAAAQQSKLRIIQTNSAGDNVHIIDAATNKVVGEIKGIEAPHGITVAPDGSRIYISEEAGDTLVVIDGKTMREIKRIHLSGNPNLVDVTPDGKRIYVAITLSWTDVSEFPQIKAAPSGGIDVIDAASLENIKTIAMKGGIHDLNVTPDGKFLVAGSARGAKPPAKLLSVIDTQTNEIAWTVPISPGPSPMAISKKSDGSTDKIFAQDGTTNSFFVVDFDTHVVSSNVKLPDIGAARQNSAYPPSPSHGMIVTSDQKTLLVNSRLNTALYAYSLPDLTLRGTAVLGGKGAEWLTITPDSKTAYVANSHTNNVSVVEIASMKEVALVPVGYAPARNVAWMAP